MKTAGTTHVSLLRALGMPESDAAWADFVERYADLIRGVARRRGLGEADQEDVLQDVLAQLARAMERFEYDPDRGRFRSYLRTITLRVIFAKFRQRHRAGTQQAFDDDAASHDDELGAAWEDEWRRHHLRRGLAYAQSIASESDLAAFRAYAIEGLPPARVAEAIGLTIDQVYQAKTRILKIIRDKVRVQIDEEG